jgi:thiosulfate reductase cytochrome b subunit
MFSANVTNRDPAEILLKITADREFPLFSISSHFLLGGGSATLASGVAVKVWLMYVLRQLWWWLRRSVATGQNRARSEATESVAVGSLWLPSR